jgi:site-specific DNA-methyltransferase (adenine-specific)
VGTRNDNGRRVPKHQNTHAPWEGEVDVPITAPATPEAAAWEGWGTALKPAWEPIVLARKPLSGTVAATVLAHGTGALNVDGCRVQASDDPAARYNGRAARGENVNAYGRASQRDEPYEASPAGRWPSNVVLDQDAAARLDAEVGELPAGVAVQRNGGGASIWGAPNTRGAAPDQGFGDTGGPSRFFYTAKAGAAERDGATHPTVKPLDLMRWLVRLVTPPGGLVLDPFLGSGTTAIAAHAEGFRCIGIEREPEYVEQAIERIRRRLDPAAAKSLVRRGEPAELSLFEAGA